MMQCLWLLLCTRPSVRMIEGTVTSLLEKDGSIVGVAYRSKTSDNPKVIFQC